MYKYLSTLRGNIDGPLHLSTVNPYYPLIIDFVTGYVAGLIESIYTTFF